MFISAVHTVHIRLCTLFVYSCMKLIKHVASNIPAARSSDLATMKAECTHGLQVAIGIAHTNILYQL